MFAYNSSFERMILEANPPEVKTRDYKGNFVCPHDGPCDIYKALPEEMKKSLEKQTCGAPGVKCAVSHFEPGSDFDKRLRESLSKYPR